MLRSTSVIACAAASTIVATSSVGGDTAVEMLTRAYRNTELPPEHVSPATFMTSLATTGSPCALPSGSPRDAAVRFVGRCRTRFRVGGCHKRIERGVDRVDARKVCIDHLAARQRPADIRRTNSWAGKWHRSVIAAHPKLTIGYYAVSAGNMVIGTL